VQKIIMLQLQSRINTCSTHRYFKFSITIVNNIFMYVIAEHHKIMSSLEKLGTIICLSKQKAQ
jgi:hypothetical protein